MSSPRFARGPGARHDVDTSRGHVTESTTSAFSTTSFDSRSEESQAREANHSYYRAARGRTASNADRDYRDSSYNTTYSSRDITKDSSFSHQHDVTVLSKRDVTFHSTEGDTSATSDTVRHASYDVQLAHYEETEYSCDEAAPCQKLSFFLLIISFLGHGLAVCTPYWVVGYQGGQVTLYEGVWLSCYRERGIGSWVCSNYDTIRGLFEQPVWYEAAQVSAVLSVVLHMPALVAATLYSFVVKLTGRSRASWLLIVFLGCIAFCSFLSFIIFASSYPSKQTFPPGEVTFYASFALQVISFFVCLVSLTTHVRDSFPNLKMWESTGICASNKVPSVGLPSLTCGSDERADVTRTKARVAGNTSQPVSTPKLKSFSMPKFPSALSRFRSKGEKPTAPPAEEIEERAATEAAPEKSRPSEVAAAAAAVAASRQGGTTVSSHPNPVANKSYVASSSDSLSGYGDSQV